MEHERWLNALRRALPAEWDEEEVGHDVGGGGGDGGGGSGLAAQERPVTSAAAELLFDKELLLMSKWSPADIEPAQAALVPLLLGLGLEEQQTVALVASHAQWPALVDAFYDVKLARTRAPSPPPVVCAFTASHASELRTGARRRSTDSEQRREVETERLATLALAQEVRACNFRVGARSAKTAHLRWLPPDRTVRARL